MLGFENHRNPMKTIRRAIVGAVVLLLTSAIHSLAITNTMITVSSGTNIVLYWPSYGYETYLIQYRQTLSATDSWSQLTNAYYANGTNFTTYTLYGVVPAPSSGGSGSGGSGGGSPPTPDMARAGSTTPSVPMVEPASGTGTAVPLALYPPGSDLTGFNIFDPATGEWMSGNGYTVSATSYSSMMGEGATPMDGGASPDDTTNDVSTPTTGFFRVFHIPDWLVSFDGYQFDGPTFLPVDYEEPDAPTNAIVDSAVLINGQVFDYSYLIAQQIDGYNYWGMGIYFDRLPNGTNTIQLLTSILQSDAVNDNTPWMTFSNAPQTIVINNLVTFTNWDDLIWDNTNYTFNAQCSVSNVNWEIDIYDINGDYVNSQTGTSADGNISWTWDLTDYTGANRGDGDSDPDFYPYITITENGGSDAQTGGASPDAGTTQPMPAVAAAFPSLGGWLVSYMDHFYTDGSSNYPAGTSDMLTGVRDMIGAATEWTPPLPATLFPIAYGKSYAQTNRDTSWYNLSTWIYYTQTRNCYYFGHGSADSIGCDYNTVDSSNNITGGAFAPNSHAYLTSKMIHDNVAFNPNGARPYRFVFLDGCNTANGSFAPAFGIPSQSYTGGWFVSDANTRHIRPCAFMGWNTEVGGTSAWGTVDKYWSWRENWIAYWANTEGDPLSDSINVATSISGWVDAGQINSHLVTDGDTDLFYQQYNYGGDWP
jgi:hypothetical protein